MASAPTITVNAYPNGVDNRQRRQVIYGTIAITAGTSAATGIPITWADYIDGNFPDAAEGSFIPQVGPDSINSPQNVQLDGPTESAAITAKQSYTYDPSVPSILVWQAGVPVDSGIVADTINFRAEYVRGKF